MRAISVSPGVAFGKVLKLPSRLSLDQVSRESSNISYEVDRLVFAVKKSVDEIHEIILRLRDSKQIDQVEIFEAHAMMTEDPELIEKSMSLIRDKKMSAAWAYKIVSDEYAVMLSSLEDEYLRERAADIRDIASRVIDHILGQKRFDFNDVAENTILVADDVTPSQMAMLNPKLVVGIITEMGGKTSHTAIIARALEIPALAGARGILSQVENGMPVLIDAFAGELTLSPDVTAIKAFEIKRELFQSQKNELLKFKNQKSETTDGRKIELAANIGGPSDVQSVIENDAEGVGLYRTEFVFLNQNRIPTSEEQYQVYRKVFDELGNKPCIIRTLDIGGDKKLEGLSIASELNPFLGLRGVRLCLEESVMFKDQLKSILRAAIGHSVGIMIPMISNIEEIVKTKKIIEDCKSELRSANMKFSENFRFGVMIEVPSAAMIVDLIARHVDFISIGTNDLTQYVCAVDRLNDKVEALYDPFNPGFLRIMNEILKASETAKLHSAICGSLAHSELLVPLFVGMGVNELSMTSQHVLSTRKRIRELNYAECKSLVAEILGFETSSEIKSHLEKFRSNNLT